MDVYTVGGKIVCLICALFRESTSRHQRHDQRLICLLNKRSFWTNQSRLPLAKLLDIPCSIPYCQTFENKSSSAPNPPAGFDVDVVLLLEGPVLLAQPPNSSSAVTLGAGLKPPPAPGTIGVLAKEPPALPVLLPHPPKSLPDGVTAVGWLGVAAAGSGVAQSLLPQTSAPDMPPNAGAGVLCFGGDCCGGAAGCWG